MNSSLSSRQGLRAILTGIVLWLVAALLIRWAGASLFEPGNPWLIAIFVACGVAALPTVVITRWCSGTRLDQQLSAVVAMTLTALLLDGVAILWFSPLYGLATDRLSLAAATLLWAVGCVLAVALTWRYR